MKVRQLPGTSERVESGPVQFGDDWPGIFIRGDNALYYASILKMTLETLPDDNPFVKATLEGLLEMLSSSQVK